MRSYVVILILDRFPSQIILVVNRETYSVVLEAELIRITVIDTTIRDLRLLKLIENSLRGHVDSILQFSERHLGA